jgi:hypothetical protein
VDRHSDRAVDRPGVTVRRILPLKLNCIRDLEPQSAAIRTSPRRPTASGLQASSEHPAASHQVAVEVVQRGERTAAEFLYIAVTTTRGSIIAIYPAAPTERHGPQQVLDHRGCVRQWVSAGRLGRCTRRTRMLSQWHVYMLEIQSAKKQTCSKILQSCLERTNEFPTRKDRLDR